MHCAAVPAFLRHTLTHRLGLGHARLGKNLLNLGQEVFEPSHIRTQGFQLRRCTGLLEAHGQWARPKAGMLF